MGQVNRVDSCRLAVSRAGEERARGAVAASDAFFPFADGLQVLLDAGVRAVVAPGGSIRDAEVVEAAAQRRRDDVLHRHPPLRPLMQAGTSRATLAAAAAAAFAGGAVMSLQSRINGELSTGFKAPLDAAMWSFGSGAVLLSLLLLAAPGVRAAVVTCRPRCGTAGCAGGSASAASAAARSWSPRPTPCRWPGWPSSPSRSSAGRPATPSSWTSSGWGRPARRR